MKFNSKPIKILILSGNLNHYKLKMLDYFNENYNVNISILCGKGRIGKGDLDLTISTNLYLKRVNTLKKYFGFHPKVLLIFLKQFSNYDWIQIPREKKNFFLLFISYVFVKIERLKGKNIRIFTITHPDFGYKIGVFKVLNILFLKAINIFYDKIIFYTKNSMDYAIYNKLVKVYKASYVNNTLFTKDIDRYYKFSHPPNQKKNILFIGRLIHTKRVDLLLKYYEKIKINLLNKGYKTELRIIGEGPLYDQIIQASKKDISIKVLGGIVKERDISKHMNNVSLVFIPGESGLSINHAFCYGKPYATIKSKNHGPEINYLKNGINGFLLSGDINSDVPRLCSILITNDKEIFNNAYKTGKNLSVDRWCAQIMKNLR